MTGNRPPSEPSRRRTPAKSSLSRKGRDHAAPLSFQARLLKPVATDVPVSWLFLLLPAEASARLPSRSMTSVGGTFEGHPFQATLEPDGQGSHWLKVEAELWSTAGVHPGDTVTLEMVPLTTEPEPHVPDDLQQALTSASSPVRATWDDITPRARRDWIHWITSARRAETRVKRIATACDMLAKGKRRPCCFDRSGMYSQSLHAPEAEELPDG